MSSPSPVYHINTQSNTSPSWNILPNVSNTTWSVSNTFDWGLPQTSLNVKGDAEFEGDIKIKGKSLVKTLEQIEDRLAIVHRNEELEEKWEELRELARKYKALEQEILEKEKIWKLLNQ